MGEILFHKFCSCGGEEYRGLCYMEVHQIQGATADDDDDDDDDAAADAVASHL